MATLLTQCHDSLLSDMRIQLFSQFQCFTDSPWWPVRSCCLPDPLNVLSQRRPSDGRSIKSGYWCTISSVGGCNRVTICCAVLTGCSRRLDEHPHLFHIGVYPSPSPTGRSCFNQTRKIAFDDSKFDGVLFPTFRRLNECGRSDRLVNPDPDTNRFRERLDFVTCFAGIWQLTSVSRISAWISFVNMIVKVRFPSICCHRGPSCNKLCCPLSVETFFFLFVFLLLFFVFCFIFGKLWVMVIIF